MKIEALLYGPVGLEHEMEVRHDQDFVTIGTSSSDALGGVPTRTYRLIGPVEGKAIYVRRD